MCMECHASQSGKWQALGLQCEHYQFWAGVKREDISGINLEVSLIGGKGPNRQALEALGC